MTIAFIVVAMMALGLILIAAEVLVIPGFGVVGVIGGVFMVAAVYVSFAYLGSSWGMLSLLGGVVAAGLLLWLLPKTKTAKQMVLTEAITGDAADPTLAALHGKTGSAASDLRPSGKAEIDGRIVDVVAEAGYIERGSTVRVVHVEGLRVVVETPDDDDSNSNSNSNSKESS